MMIKKYILVWWIFAKNAFQEQLSTRVSAMFFFIGKMTRFIVFLLFLLLLSKQTRTLAGYPFEIVILFFMTFNVIDIFSQMFMRGVYTFGPKVRTGEFDYDLARPVHPLFRALVGNPDFNDMFLAIPVFGFFFWHLTQINLELTPMKIFLYFAFLVNSFLIATAFHIFVLCIGVVTTEVDHAIWMYRDITQAGRFPLEIFRESIRTIFTFVVPIGIMINVPVQVLIGESRRSISFAFVFGIGMIFLSLFTWKKAVKSYTSAGG